MQKLRDVVFPGGHLNKDVVGKPATQIGAMAGIDVPETARIILLPAEGRRHGRRAGQGKALPGGGDPAVQDVRGCRGQCQGQPARRRRRPLGGAALEQRRATSAMPGIELPISRLVVNQACALTAGRLADQRLCADHDAGLRLVGRQLDFREPRLQAPDERVAHRQGDHAQEGADRRRNLGMK